MLKLLLRKQLLELNSAYFFDRKKNKLRSKGGVIGIISIFVAMFIGFGYAIFMLAKTMIPLVTGGVGWFYYFVFGLMGMASGLLGSVFGAYFSLFKAKDNELIFSLPIPPWTILFVRITGVAVMALIFGSLVYVPILLARCIYAPISALGVINYILLGLVNTLFVTALSCFLGYVVAQIAKHVKKKSLVTVLASLLILGLYYFAYFKAQKAMQSLLVNGAVYAGKVKSWVWPFYQMGLGAEGNALSMLIYCAIVGAIFALCYVVLARSFVKISIGTTAKVGKKKGQEKIKNIGSSRALLKREFKHYLNSPAYMLNCSLGTVLMLAVAIFVIVKRNMILGLFAPMGVSKEMVLLMLTACAMMLTSMNAITSVAISIEGNRLWVLRSLPVSAVKVLNAKQYLHLLLTLVPALIMTIAVVAVAQAGVLMSILSILTVCAVVVFDSCFGLMMNLVKPMLVWTNETMATKQSFSALITVFGIWVLVLALCGIYYALRNVLAPVIYLAIVLALFVGAIICINIWLRKKGVEKFDNL